MTDIYLRSTDGLDADNGTTWALADATLAGAIADMAAGDTLYVSQNHAEVPTTSQTWTFPGTQASPNKVLSVDSAGDPQPPTSLATGANASSTTSAVSYTINGVAYLYGFRFTSATGASASSITLGNTDNSQLVLEQCPLEVPSTSTSGAINIGSTTASNEADVTLKSCILKFGSTNQKVVVRNARFRWYNGSVSASGALPTALLGVNVNGLADILLDGVNLSSLSSTFTLISITGGMVRAVFRNCRMPSGWTGTTSGGTVTVAKRISMYNCDAGSPSTNYRLLIDDTYGTIVSETTVVRSGGANDGTTPISWKMVSSNAVYPSGALVSDPIAIWNDTVGSAVTLSVEINTSVTGLKNDEIWLEAEYLSSATQTVSALATNCKSSPLVAGTTHPSSSMTWNGGLASAVPQRLSVTVTPLMKGPILVRVCLAGGSLTTYVDPKLVIS